MPTQRKSGKRAQLRVLVIEHDAAALARTCAKLLEDGLDVSTARTAAALVDQVSQIEPDIVLMDVLMPDLDSHELARLAARCQGGSPALVVHTRVVKALLKRLIDVRAIFGFIPKTEDDAAFMPAFRNIADRLISELPTRVFVQPAGSATSGTFVRSTATAAARGGARARSGR